MLLLHPPRWLPLLALPVHHGLARRLTLLVRNVQAAIAVLEERSRLPAPGVHTPVSLLRKTGYVERLQRHGIKFEQLDSPAVQ